MPNAPKSPFHPEAKRRVMRVLRVLRVLLLGGFVALGGVSSLIHSWNPDHVLALGDNNYPLILRGSTATTPTWPGHSRPRAPTRSFRGMIIPTSASAWAVSPIS